MTSGAPWSVKGIDPRAREVAKELAARAGMTLGEWLNRSILDGETPPAARTRLSTAGPASAEGGRDPFDRPEADLRRLTDVLHRLADRLDVSEARTGKALSSLETKVRTTLGRLEQATVRTPPQVRQEARSDRHEGVLRALESALSRLAAQVQDGEARTRDALDGLRIRLDRAEARPQGSGMDQIAVRLGEIQDRTATAMNTLREAFSGLDERLARLESVAGDGLEGRLREVSFRLGERLDAARAEMSRELTEASARRLSELERAFAELSRKVERVESEAVARLARSEDLSEIAGRGTFTGHAPDVLSGRIDESGDQGHLRAEFGQTETLARLGDEIARIGDRLGIRAEPGSTASGDGRELSAGEEISRRIRQSEDRTARLLEEARLRLDSHFPPSRTPVAATRFDDEEHARALALFDDEGEAPGSGSDHERQARSPEFEEGGGYAEDWPLDLLAEARAANARNSSASTGDPEDVDPPTLPGIDLSKPRPTPRPARFAARGGLTTAIFCISVSLVGYAALTLLDGPGTAPPAAANQTEPRALAAAPRTAVMPAETPVRAAVAIAPQPAALNAPPPAKGPAQDAVSSASTPASSKATASDARFRKAQADLAAGRPAGLNEIRTLAGMGYPPAMRVLSGLYNKGESGVARDPGLARSWIRRAAEAGDRLAMHGYGLELMNGVNGPRDTTGAVAWIRRAAEAGLVDSQFNMGAIYERGMGVPQDPRQAYVWYTRAANGGDGEALRQVERLRPVLAATASRSSDDVRTAQRALSRLGYYSGPADGALTPQLRSALEAYQKDQRTPATGLLDDATLRRLAMLGR